MRRVDPNGETLVWCRKWSGCARCRLEPKLMNRCRPERKQLEDIYGAVGLWNIAKKKMLEDRGALPKQEVDFNR